MLLISEEITQPLDLVEEVIEESDGKKKALYLEGVYLQAEQKNRNGRIYPKAILAREVARYTKDYIKENRAYGELGHPDGPTVNLHRVSHLITGLEEQGNDWIGKAKVMDTEYGLTVKAILESGGKLGVSSRGMGSLMKKNGINEVQKDYHLVTAADIVADPSAHNAFVEGIMEGVEWIKINETWVPQYIDETRKKIHNTPKAQLQEAKLKAFQGFLSKL